MLDAQWRCVIAASVASHYRCVPPPCRRAAVPPCRYIRAVPAAGALFVCGRTCRNAYSGVLGDGFLALFAVTCGEGLRAFVREVSRVSRAPENGRARCSVEHYTHSAVASSRRLAAMSGRCRWPLAVIVAALEREARARPFRGAARASVRRIG